MAGPPRGVSAANGLMWAVRKRLDSKTRNRADLCWVPRSLPRFNFFFFEILRRQRLIRMPLFLLSMIAGERDRRLDGMDLDLR